MRGWARGTNAPHGKWQHLSERCKCRKHLLGGVTTPPTDEEEPSAAGCDSADVPQDAQKRKKRAQFLQAGVKGWGGGSRPQLLRMCPQSPSHIQGHRVTVSKLHSGPSGGRVPLEGSSLEGLSGQPPSGRPPTSQDSEREDGPGPHHFPTRRPSGPATAQVLPISWVPFSLCPQRYWEGRRSCPPPGHRMLFSPAPVGSEGPQGLPPTPGKATLERLETRGCLAA